MTALLGIALGVAVLFAARLVAHWADGVTDRAMRDDDPLP